MYAKGHYIELEKALGSSEGHLFFILGPQGHFQ